MPSCSSECPILSRVPFLRRAAKPMLGRPLLWCISLGLGLFTYMVVFETDGMLAFYLLLTGILSFYTAMRALDDDQASGTLEQLEVLPVSRLRIVLETAAGSLLAFTLLCGIPLAMGAFSARGAFSWSRLANAVPWLVALPLLGTLLSLRHRMRWPARLVWYSLLAFVSQRFLLHFDGNGRVWDFRFGRVALELGGVLVTWAVGWRLGHLLGGGWSAQDTSHTVRALGGAPKPERLKPDGWNPLLWREVRLGWKGVVVVAVLGALHLSTANGSRWDTPMARLVNLLWWLITWACMSARLRTSEDRISGMWADLATTPITARSILWNRVRGMLMQAGAMLLGWGLLVLVLPGAADPSLKDMAGFSVFIALGLLAAVLSGFLAGTSGRGLLAGLAGLFMMYVLMMIACMPAAFIACLFDGVRHWNPALAAILCTMGGLLSLAIYYAVLVCGSLSGIQRAAEEQRA